MKDKDLDLLLSEYRNNAPSDMQMQKWKNAVRAELKTKKPALKVQQTVWMQLAAASLVGFIAGALVFGSIKTKNTYEEISQNDDDSATIEYVVTKSN